MQDKKALFQSFSDGRLIEVVKNAKQFGYDKETINLALEVLKERDISETDLELTGNLTNAKFDSAADLFQSYNTFSKIAFIAYFVALFLRAITVFHLFGIYEPGTFMIIFYWLVLIIFLIALIQSFLIYLNFHKAIEKVVDTGGQIIYFALGMPFYIFMFFFYRSRMKEEMSMLH